MRTKWAHSAIVAVFIILASPCWGADDPSLIRRVQARLADFGFDPGPVDGIMNARTQSALRAFQRKEGLSPSGKIDTQTQWTLGVATQAPRSAWPAPGSGEVSFALRTIQERLAKLGYDPGPAGGVLNEKTRAAVRAFQESQGLPATGEPNDATQAALSAPSFPTTPAPPEKAPVPVRAPSNVKLPSRPSPAEKSATAEPVTIPPAPQPAAPPTPPQPVASTTVVTGAPLSPTKPATSTTPSPKVRSLAEAKDKSDAGSTFWWLLGAGALILWLVGRRKRKLREVTPIPEWESPELEMEVQLVEPTQMGEPLPAAQRGGEDLWVPGGKSAKVSGLSIGGMVYVGRGLYDRFDRIENCLIDPSLPVAKRSTEVSDAYMPYWPSYSNIAPNSRRAYLEWLAAGRSDPDVYIGYVFLYFYGLERRLFVDRPDEAEIRALVAEVERLLEIYGTNNSFLRYADALLDTAALLLPEQASLMPEPEELLSRSGWEMPLSLRVALGCKIAAGETLDASALLCWWLAHPETRLRTAARRAFDEFRLLFEIRFAAAYPDGLAVSAPKSRISHTYRAASSTFERRFTDEIEWCPDVSRLRRPINIAAGIAEVCMDDLAAYSRYLGRKPDGRGTIEAHALLPEELAATLPNAELQELKSWTWRQIEEVDGLVPIEQVLERLEGQPPEKVGRRALTSAADALARIGVGLAPDPRFAIRAPKLGEPVVLFRLPGATMKLEDVSGEYPGAVLNLALGSYIAHADGIVSNKEKQRLEAQINRVDGLSAAEQARLRANLQWMLAVPPTLAPVRKRLAGLHEAEKYELGRIAIAMAGADGMIEPAEVDAVRKLYRTMNLPVDGIYAQLHELAADPAIEPVTVVRPSQVPSGYAIPAPPEPVKRSKRGAVNLNLDRVSEIMADTHRVSAVLSDIFVEDAAEAEPDPVADDDTVSTVHDGLDAPHRALLEELLNQPAWTAANFAQLAGQFGLMADGAHETLNEWAYDSFDEPVLEGDDELVVNTEIVEALRRTTRGGTDGASQHPGT